MPIGNKYLEILARLTPASAAGILILLGSTVHVAASEAAPADPPAASRGVAERLDAIREAVSQTAGPPQVTDGTRVAWWANWHNGGWRNGGWRNGGWPNYWRNW
jgi:hypothetical protein